MEKSYKNICNKDDPVAYQAAYYKENRERLREYKKLYYKRNKKDYERRQEKRRVHKQINNSLKGAKNE